jgi:WD40 repeat protein
MNCTKKVSAFVGAVILMTMFFVGVPLHTMISQKSMRLRTQRPVQQIPPEVQQMVWVKTLDNVIMEIPQRQIDQMKVLQMLFVHQKGKNSKNNPINASMVTSDQLMLLQKALNVPSNLNESELFNEFELFYENLSKDEQAMLINGAFILEAQSLVSLVTNIKFSPEVQEKLGSSIITAGSIIAPVVEYLKTKENEKKILKGHTREVNCVAYSFDGSYMISGADDNNLILWDGKTGEQIKILKGHKNWVSCLAYSPDGNYIVSGSADSNLILWNGKTGEQIKILQGHKNWVSCLAYSPDGDYIVSGSEDKNLILWSGKTGEKIKTLEGHKDEVSCVAYSPDGDYIISGARDNNLILWNGKTGEQIKILKGHLKGHNGWVNCIAYSPDNYIVSGLYIRDLILWNGKTGEKINILQGYTGKVSCVAYSPDGNYIVSGLTGPQNNLILWDGKTGERIKIFRGHVEGVLCVAYSSDGNYIVSGSYDENLILWDSKTGEQIKIFKGHKGKVSCVAYSPDGDCIVSGSHDNNLILWKFIDQKTIDFIATKLNIAQARFLYRLYLAQKNEVPVILYIKDADYQIYLTLPDDVQRAIKTFLPFKMASD